MPASITSKPLKNSSASGGKLKELVDSHLRALIFEQKVLSAGEQINEREISRTLGISRAPVREALKELEAQGLIVSEKYRGWFVADFRKEEFYEINKLRSLLEYNLLESVFASGGPSASDLERLEAINRDIRLFIKESDTDNMKAFRYAEKEIVFHSALHELGKENCFWTKKMLSTLSYQLRSALRYWLYEEWQMEMSADFHDLLLSCLRKKDIEGLRHLLFKRLERGPLSGRAQ